MTRPLVSVALAYVGGLLLGDWLQPPWWSLCVISLWIAAGAIVWERGHNCLPSPFLGAEGGEGERSGDSAVGLGREQFLRRAD